MITIPLNEVIEGLGNATGTVAGLASESSATVKSNVAKESDFSNTSWTSYTPTITSSTGALTSYSATGYYKQLGKVVHLSVSITITDNGTGSGFIVCTLPINAIRGTYYTGAGRENALTGKMLQTMLINTSQLGVWNYDNTYPATTNAVLVISSTYEVV